MSPITSLLEPPTCLHFLAVCRHIVPIDLLYQLLRVLENNCMLKSLMFEGYDCDEVKRIGKRMVDLPRNDNSILESILFRDRGLEPIGHDVELSYFRQLNACSRVKVNRSDTNQAEVVDLLVEIHSRHESTEMEAEFDELSLWYGLLRAQPHL